MPIPDEVRLAIEGMGILGSASVILLKLGRIGERIDTHGKEIEKMGEALVTIAAQKEEIRSLREIQSLNTKRTDETFNRIFSLLDRFQDVK